MAELGFKTLIIGLLVLGLFIFCTIQGALFLAINNDASQSIGDDPRLTEYKSELEAQLLESSGDSRAADAAITNSSFTLTTSFPVFDAIGGVWKTYRAVPIALYNLTVGLLVSYIFGETFRVVFAVVAAIIGMLIILGVWQLIATGRSP